MIERYYEQNISQRNVAKYERKAAVFNIVKWVFIALGVMFAFIAMFGHPIMFVFPLTLFFTELIQ